MRHGQFPAKAHQTIRTAPASKPRQVPDGDAYHLGTGHSTCRRGDGINTRRLSLAFTVWQLEVSARRFSNGLRELYRAGPGWKGFERVACRGMCARSRFGVHNRPVSSSAMNPGERTEAFSIAAPIAHRVEYCDRPWGTASAGSRPPTDRHLNWPEIRYHGTNWKP